MSLPQDVQTPLHVFILKNHPPVLLLMKNLLIVHMILLTQLQMKSFPDFAACTTAPMLPLKNREASPPKLHRRQPLRLTRQEQPPQITTEQTEILPTQPAQAPHTTTTKAAPLPRIQPLPARIGTPRNNKLK